MWVIAEYMSTNMLGQNIDYTILSGYFISFPRNGHQSIGLNSYTMEYAS